MFTKLSTATLENRKEMSARWINRPHQSGHRKPHTPVVRGNPPCLLF